jgi:predicted esterase
MDTHHLETLRTARYHTLGDAGRSAEIWFLLHGYGQSAADMLNASSALAGDDRLLVAPEGLSRFYQRGGTGPVGASWMTREDREHEIRDCMRWLDGLAAHLRNLHGARRTVVLGFSQGAAAAWRWALLGSSKLERLIAWGGALPSDLDVGRHADRLRALQIHIVRGASDATYDAQTLERDREHLAGIGVVVDMPGFQGGHRLDDALLRQLSGAGPAQ